MEQLEGKSSCHHLHQGTRKLHSLLCIAHQERERERSQGSTFTFELKGVRTQAYRPTGGTNSSQRQQYQLAPDGKRQAQEPYQQKPRPHGNIRTQFSHHSKSRIPQHTRKARVGFKIISHDTDRGLQVRLK